MSIQLGVIGAGGIAGMHLQSLSQVENANVVGITDLDRVACVSRQEEFCIDRVADDIDTLLASDIDAVLVCTPTFTHCDIVTRAARAGKHVFCEKPMARTLAEADQMIEACDKAGVSLMIGFVRRFCPQCGSRLFGRNSARPGVIAVAVGTVDDNSWFQPQAALYSKDRLLAQNDYVWLSRVPETLKEKGSRNSPFCRSIDAK